MIFKIIITLSFFGLCLGSVLLSQKLETCDPSKCKLPKCLCSATTPPNNLDSKKIPQIVTLTFDDSVQTLQYENWYKHIITRKNPDKCPVQLTLFMCHEYTNYSLVNKLYNQGHEIALHSITHLTNNTYWLEPKDSAELENHYKQELIDQILLTTTFSNIDKEGLRGVRVPFLHMAGNAPFRVLSKNKLLYDFTRPTQINNPPLFPYTLDYASTQECNPPCVPLTESFPGVWVVPLVDWEWEGVVCSMSDQCVLDAGASVDTIFNFIKSNFERHYNTNRAPFPFSIHAAWFAKYSNAFAAYEKFLDYALGLKDVYFTSVTRMLEWMKNPNEIPNLNKTWPKCAEVPRRECRSEINCRLVKQEEWGPSERYMSMCMSETAHACPKAYPWIGNPQGNDTTEY